MTTNAKSTSSSHPDKQTPALCTKRPWVHLGFSRATWYRLLAAGAAPMPLNLPCGGNLWRFADLDAWLAKQRPARALRKRPTPPETN